MGRKRRHGKVGKGRGGAMSSLRGGFRSVAGGVMGTRNSRPTSRGGRALGNAITVTLLVVAAAFLLHRFGILHWPVKLPRSAR